jgi:hypothetical protein
MGTCHCLLVVRESPTQEPLSAQGGRALTWPSSKCQPTLHRRSVGMLPASGTVSPLPRACQVNMLTCCLALFSEQSLMADHARQLPVPSPRQRRNTSSTAPLPFARVRVVLQALPSLPRALPDDARWCPTCTTARQSDSASAGLPLGMALVSRPQCNPWYLA